MPTVKLPNKSKATKATGSKASGSKAAKATANGRRTKEDVDAMVGDFRKHLQNGGTMRELKTEYGFSDDGPIRQALARAGYDSKGNKLELPTVAATAKGVANARKQGHAWYTIALATGKTEAELKELARKGGSEFVEGRAHVGGGRGR